MPVFVNWEEPDKVLQVKFGDYWTEEEYTVAVQEANDKVRPVEGRVCVILNYEENKVQPEGNMFRRGRDTLSQMPDNVRHIIVVGGDSLSRTFFSTFFKVYKPKGVNVEFVGTFREAMARI